MKNFIILLCFIVPVASCSGPEETYEPKNIILMIGDGMGFAHVTATEYAHGPLKMTSTPYAGSIYTHSNDSKVTGSAAAATAMATGYKTNNRMLGQLPDGTPVQSIAHYASEIGKSTALIANCRITHATPAAFAVHHDDRGDSFIIAEKMVESGIDMLLGAGYNHFLPEEKGGRRTDGRNLITELEERGYLYIDDENELDRISEQDKVAAFFQGGMIPRYPQRGDIMSRITRAALERLSQNEEGFFMMFEGAMIDWAGHDNEAEDMIHEMIDFDNVIGDVLEFAENDGNTLVVITSDHETGGLTLLRGEDRDVIDHHWVTGSHTATQVPVFSYGPSAELFSGTYDNTGIARKMFSLWGKTIED